MSWVIVVPAHVAKHVFQIYTTRVAGIIDWPYWFSNPWWGQIPSPTPDDGIKNHPTQTMAAWATTRMRQVYISQNTEIVVQK